MEKLMCRPASESSTGLKGPPASSQGHAASTVCHLGNFACSPCMCKVCPTHFGEVMSIFCYFRILGLVNIKNPNTYVSLAALGKHGENFTNQKDSGFCLIVLEPTFLGVPET